MPVRNLRDGTIKVQVDDNGSGSAAEVEVTLEEGNLRWTERRPVAMISDRGTLDHARRSPMDEVAELSFSVMFQTFQDPNSDSATLYEAITQTGQASSWVSQDFGGVSDRYSVNLEFTVVDPNGGTSEVLNFDYCHFTEPEFEEGEEFSTLAVSAQAPLYWADFLWTPEDGLRPRIGSVLGAFGRASTATYRDSSGVMQTAASGVPRWKHHESGVRGYLGEPQRTNSFTQSEDLTHGDWTVAALSARNADQATGPDGTVTLDELVENSGAGRHGVSQDITLTADETYAFSAWYSANTRTIAHLSMFDAAAGSNRLIAFFDLQAGTVGTTDALGTASLSDAYLEDWTDVVSGLYRVTMVGSVGNAATNIRCMALMADADGNETYTGDGSSSIYAGFVQAEDAAAAGSSYIATTTAAATRQADDLQFPLPAAITTPAELTVYVAGTELGSIHEDSFTTAVAVGGSSAPFFRLDTHSTNRWTARHNNNTDAAVTSVAGSATSIRDFVELRAPLASDGEATIAQATAHGDETVASGSGAPASGLAGSWSSDVIDVNEAGGSLRGLWSYSAILIARRTRTLADIRKMIR